MALWIRCQKSTPIDTAAGRRWRSPIEVSGEQGEASIDDKYKYMCASIADAVGPVVLEAWLSTISRIESGLDSIAEESTEGWTVQMATDKVSFENEYAQVSGGEVSLQQFKLALQIYWKFLLDPQKLAIEMPFVER